MTLIERRDDDVHRMLELIGEGTDVLEIAGAGRSLAKELAAAGCRVVAIDDDPQAAEAARPYCVRSVAADLNDASLALLLSGTSFDTIIFNGVLERFRAPHHQLSEARQLVRDGGCLLATARNVAHGDIRLALLAGRFDYRDYGINGEDIARFFTAKTLEELLLGAGFAVVRVDRVKVPLFTASRELPPVSSAEVDERAVAEVRSDPEHDTLQFLVKAVPISDEARLQALLERSSRAETKLQRAGSTIAKLERELNEAQLSLERLRLAAEASEAALREARTEAAAAMRRLCEEHDRALAAHDVQVAELEKRSDGLGAALDSVERDRDAARSLTAPLQAELEVLRAENARIAGELESLAGRFLEHVNRTIADTRESAATIAREIDEIQAGAAWRAKRALRRLIPRRGS